MKLSHDGLYLVAKDDQESVCLEREGSSKNAIWAVEFVNGKEDKNYVRFKSCYDRYLTASNVLLRQGSRERKVLQTLQQDEPCIDWEPIRDDFISWRFQTPFGSFLRRNWGLPPLWNPVTHDIPRQMRIHKVLWDVEVLEAMPKPPFSYPLPLPLPPDMNSDSSSPLLLLLPSNLNGDSSASSNVNVPADSSPPTIAPSKFGKDEQQVAWPLPRPPISLIGHK